ncbi:MAG: hypothetical protein ACLSF4_03230 [Hominenteromicrobium sp.]|uniref:hypothetical protein n=1 Tax=Hominenteromicrobium sp. TaxID=3073581 RepID=UPI003996AFD1
MAGLVVAVGLEVGFAVGAAVGLVVDAVVGFAVAEGFAVALLPEDGLLTVLLPELGFVVADGFAVALGFDTVLPVELEDDGLLVVLFSVLDEADELLPFELSVLLLSVFAPGVAVGFALAVLELAVGLLLASFFPIPCCLPHWMWSFPYGAFGIAARTRRKRYHKCRRHQYCCDLFLHSRSLLI